MDKTHRQRAVECLLAAQTELVRTVAAALSGGTPYDGMRSAEEHMGNARYWLGRDEELRAALAATEPKGDG